MAQQSAILAAIEAEKQGFTTETAVRILAVVAVLSCLYFARALFLPIMLAILLSLTLTPIVQWGQKLRIPPSAMAALLIISIGAAAITTVTTLAAPVAEIVAQTPQLGDRLKQKLIVLRRPVESINKVGEEVEKIGDGDEPDSAQEVVIKQRGLVTRAADDLIAFFATALLTLTLSFFLLKSRDLFYLKVVRVLPTLTDRKNALHVARQMEQDISRYLLTVSLINVSLGIAVGCCLWLLGMPNPLLWGLFAAMLNFLPYVGAIMGVTATAIVAILTYDTLTTAMLPPLAYAVLTIIEGQFVTPMTLSNRFSLNTVVIILSIAFWGFMWGAIGVLVAVPILIALKIFCERIDGLSGLGEFLSGETPPAQEDEQTQAS